MLRVRDAAARALRAIVAIVGVDECVLVLGLILLALGFRQMPSWGAGAYLAPAAILLWLAVPQRAAFVRKEPAAVQPQKRRV